MAHDFTQEVRNKLKEKFPDFEFMADEIYLYIQKQVNPKTNLSAIFNSISYLMDNVKQDKDKILYLEDK